MTAAASALLLSSLSCLVSGRAAIGWPRPGARCGAGSRSGPGRAPLCRSRPVQEHGQRGGQQRRPERDQGDLPAGHAAGDDGRDWGLWSGSGPAALPRRRTPPPRRAPAYPPSLRVAAPGRRRAHQQPDRPPTRRVGRNRPHLPAEHLRQAASVEPHSRGHPRLPRPHSYVGLLPSKLVILLPTAPGPDLAGPPPGRYRLA
jgi:hypothetical protein